MFSRLTLLISTKNSSRKLKEFLQHKDPKLSRQPPLNPISTRNNFHPTIYATPSHSPEITTPSFPIPAKFSDEAKQINFLYTGGRENGDRRRLRERAGEVQRREPDLGAVFRSPIAAIDCTQETKQSRNRIIPGSEDHAPPHQIEPFQSAEAN